MTQSQQYRRWWQPISKKLAAKRPIVWLMSHTLHHLDRLALWISGGKVSAASILTGLPVVTLQTTGAKSGKTRSVPLIGFPDGEKLVFVASNWGQSKHPSWYYNLRTNPEAIISIQGHSRKYIAHEANELERELYWSQAVNSHAGYAAYKRQANGRQIPIIVCVPKENEPAAGLPDG
jgi:deazaflavin-dependent oxidoreductase (nitroreductase family)